MYEQPFFTDFDYITAMIFDHMGIEYTPAYMARTSESS